MCRSNYNDFLFLTNIIRKDCPNSNHFKNAATQKFKLYQAFYQPSCLPIHPLLKTNIFHFNPLFKNNYWIRLLLRK